MDCRECGAANPEEAKVCESCGAELPGHPPGPTGVEKPAPARAKKRDAVITFVVVGFIIVVIVGVMFPFLVAARERARRTRCASNLKNIGYCLHLYSGDFGERFPAYGHLPCVPGSDPEPDLNAAMAGLGMLYPSYIADPNIFVCLTALSAQVMDATTFGTGLTAPDNFDAVHSDYGYDPTHTSTHAPTVAVMADQPACVGARGNSPNHGGVGQNVLYIGSNVMWSTTPYCSHEEDHIYTDHYEGPAGYEPVSNHTLHSFIQGEAPWAAGASKSAQRNESCHRGHREHRGSRSLVASFFPLCVLCVLCGSF